MSFYHQGSFSVFLALACYFLMIFAPLTQQSEELKAVETTSKLLRNGADLETVYDDNADVIYVFPGYETRSINIQRYSVADGSVSLMREIKEAGSQRCIVADGMGSFYIFVFFRDADTTVYKFTPATNTLDTIAVLKDIIWRCVVVNQTLVLALAYQYNYIGVIALDPTTKKQRILKPLKTFRATVFNFGSKVEIGPNPQELSVWRNIGDGYLYHRVYNYETGNILSSKFVQWQSSYWLTYIGADLWISERTGYESTRLTKPNQDMTAWMAWTVTGIPRCFGCGYAYAKRWNRIYIFMSESEGTKNPGKIYYVNLDGIVNLTSVTPPDPLPTLPMIAVNVIVTTQDGISNLASEIPELDPVTTSPRTAVNISSVTQPGDSNNGTTWYSYSVVVVGLITSVMISCVLLIIVVVMRRPRRRVVDAKATVGSRRNRAHDKKSAFKSEQIRLQKYEGQQEEL